MVDIDSDFLSLLQQAKEKRFLTISMTDERIQTSKLVRECDVVVGPFVYDTNWIDSSNSTRGSSKPGSLISEDDDSTEEDEIVRNVVRAPLPSLISSSTAKSLSKDVPMQAISRSDDGYKFMIERRQAQDGLSEKENTVAQWDLRYGYIDRSSPSVSGAAETKEKSKGSNSKNSKQAGLPSRKELAKQHIPWASVYKVSTGGSTKKKTTEA